MGATYQAGPATTLFAGVHRGFAPPRTEDLIDNSTGGVVDLDAELSWNYEIGVRTSPLGGLQLEATGFHMDFENQIIPASLAGGSGSTLTSAGQTVHRGLELGGRLSTASWLGGRHDVYLRAAWTWLPTARFAGERVVYVGTGGADEVGKVYAAQNSDGTREQVSVTGRRLPYAPRNLLTGTVGYAHQSGLDLQLEGVHVGRQFSTALNTTLLSADGQQGPISAFIIWNLAASWHIQPLDNTVFVTVKNLFDKVYVVDRTRGLIPGSPRLVQAGIVQGF
jgi:Fe(3+) dicitrate transport protein